MCSGSSRSFAKETSSRWRAQGQPSEVDSDQRTDIIKLILLQLLKVQKNPTPFYSHSAFEANWKAESSISGCFMSWLQIKNLLLILHNNNKPFLVIVIVMCNKKWILYNPGWQSAQWLDWEKAPKHFLKPNLHQIKGRGVSLRSAASLIHVSFLNPSETITSDKYAEQVDEMNRKLQSLQLALVNTKGPIPLHDNARPAAQPTLPKLNKLAYKVWPHPPYSPEVKVSAAQLCLTLATPWSPAQCSSVHGIL